MQINLLRHGRPGIDPTERIVPADFRRWMARYNRSAISDRPTQYAISSARQCQQIVCSDLLRSAHSAELLGLKVDQIDPLFREAELPSFSWRGPKMAAGNFAILARLVWVGGYSRDCETYRAARGRAEEGADRLIELAHSHQQVLLIGHGMMNRLIGRALKKRNWQIVRTARVYRYWGISTFRSDA